jgi:hypothetical protein
MTFRSLENFIVSKVCNFTPEDLYWLIFGKKTRPVQMDFKTFPGASFTNDVTFGNFI